MTTLERRTRWAILIASPAAACLYLAAAFVTRAAS